MQKNGTPLRRGRRMTTNLPVDKLDARLVRKALLFYRNAGLTFGGDAWEMRRSAVLIGKTHAAERAVIQREQKRAATVQAKKTRAGRKGRQRRAAPPTGRGRRRASGSGRLAA